MAKLINGNGNPAVYAAEDSDWFAAIMGNTTAITAIGEQFRADQADANTIEVFDGVIITKEGRRIQLDANDVDLFTIPTGTPGDTSYYIIGYHLVTDSDSNQSCETFVQKMEDGTETIPEDTFRGGADDVYISLYRVIQDGLNIDSINLLLPSIRNIKDLDDDVDEIKSDLSEIGMIYDTTDGKIYQYDFATGTRGPEISVEPKEPVYIVNHLGYIGGAKVRIVTTENGVATNHEGTATDAWFNTSYIQVNGSDGYATGFTVNKKCLFFPNNGGAYTVLNAGQVIQYIGYNVMYTSGTFQFFD